MVGSNIEMNKNQLLEPVIENSASQPSSPVEGQMYYDTTVGDKKMYFYNGSAWVEMDGSGSGVISLTPTNGTFIDITQNATSGAITTTADLSATGTPSATKFLRGDNVWATPAGAYTKWQYQTDGGTAIDMVDGEVLNFIGGTGISLADAAASPNTLTITNSGVTSIVAGSNISISGSTGAVTISAVGDVTGIDAGDGIRIDDGGTATPEVNVQYTGTNNVVVKAANAEGTDIAAGDLIIYADSSASDAVKRGLVSDLPFAPSSVTTGVTSVGLSAPSAFTVSGSPVTGSGTLAFTGAGTTAQYVDGTGSLQTFPSIPQGDVTKVIPSTANAKLGISVDNQGGPIPEVGLSIGTLADIGVSSNLDDADEFPFLDESVTTNKKVTLRELKDYITDSQSYAVTLTSPSAGSETVTHNLGSYDVIVQLYGDTSKETIYACVDRTSTNALSITFDSSVGQDVRVLVSRVTNE